MCSYLPYCTVLGIMGTHPFHLKLNRTEISATLDYTSFIHCTNFRTNLVFLTQALNMWLFSLS